MAEEEEEGEMEVVYPPNFVFTDKPIQPPHQIQKGKLPSFTCAAQYCKQRLTEDTIRDHLQQMHGASACVQMPLPGQDTVSWEVKLNNEPLDDYFAVCQVPPWGLFIFHDIRFTQGEATFSRISVRYLGTSAKANAFQYEIRMEKIFGKISVSGEVEHLFKPPCQLKSFLTWNRKTAAGGENLPETKAIVTICKKEIPMM